MSTPVIFPTSRRGFDAGLAAPNTAASAVLMITSRFRIPYSEIIVVSLGGASRTRDLPIEESLNWGTIPFPFYMNILYQRRKCLPPSLGAQQWLPYLAQVTREASSRMCQQLVSETCGERFIHFTPSLTDTVMLDECNADALQKVVTESDIAPLVDFVRQRMAEL